MRVYVTQVQMLHCIKQAGEGGDNIFADGFQVAHDMRRDGPDSFNLLANTPVQFTDVVTDEGREYHMMSKAPTLVLVASTHFCLR